MADLTVDVTSPTMVVDAAGTTTHVVDPAPAMPALQVVAAMSGVDPAEVDVANLPYSWQLEIVFDEDGRADTVTVPAAGWVTVDGGVWEPAFEFMGGGRLVVRCGVDLPDGTHLDADTTGQDHRVLGLNPQKQDVRDRVADRTALSAVFWKESRFTQFCDGKVSNAFVGGPHGPIRGRDPKGTVGWGMGQLTMSPEPSPTDLWDWTNNVDSSCTKLRSLRDDARAYVVQVKQGLPWNGRTGGKPPDEGVAHPEAPDMTDDELDLEMFARYNGGYRYHDFDPPTGSWVRRIAVGGNDQTTSLPYADDLADVTAAVEAGTPPAGWN